MKTIKADYEVVDREEVNSFFSTKKKYYLVLKIITDLESKIIRRKVSIDQYYNTQKTGQLTLFSVDGKIFYLTEEEALKAYGNY